MEADLLTTISWLWQAICLMSGIVVTVSLTTYLVPSLYFALFARPQNLRLKYGRWAVVTGASSGIGRALAEKLLHQGIDVVLVALDNAMLTDTRDQLRQRYCSREVRSVGVDLTQATGEPYMQAIGDATEDIRVDMVFSNAGFINMNYFHDDSIEHHLALLQCNALASVRIVDHFYKRMIAEGIKGCICQTSSAVCYLPAPFACMYGASKALLNNFMCSLAIEADKFGIDVTTVCPSYTHSNFYQSTPKLDVLALLSKFGWTPDSVADAILASVGRTVVRDIGSYAMLTNIFGRILDESFLSAVIMPFRESMAPKPPPSSTTTEADESD